MVQQKDSMKSTSVTLEHDLSKFLLHYRKAPHSITKLLFGREIRSRLDFIKPEVKHKQRTTVKNNLMRDFDIKDRVAARDYFSKNKWKLGTVIKRLGNLHYLVELDIGTVWRRHVNQLVKVGQNTPKTIDFGTTPPDRQLTSDASLPDDRTRDVQDSGEMRNVIDVHLDNNQPVNKDDIIVIPDSPTLRRSNRIRKAPERYGVM